MNLFSSWLNRVVDKRVQALLEERQPKKATRRVTDTDSFAPTYEERVQQMLPRIFQRTPASLVPSHADGVYEGTGMDAAPEHLRNMSDLFGIQPGVSEQMLGWYAAQSFIGHQTSAILAQHWLIKKACLVPARDAVRNGYKHGFADGTDISSDVAAEIQADLKTIDKRMGIIRQCRELVYFARIFGIRHALFEIDGIDYTAPFNLDGVRPGSYRGISQIDPYWMVPELDGAAMANPAGRHFYEPTYWRLPDGRRVHRSHFVIVKTSDVADILKPTYMFGGIPLPQEIYSRVYAAERVADEAPELALTKRLVTMSGSLENYIANTNEVTERMNAFNRVRNNHGFLVVDEEETINQHDTSLADFDAVLMSQYQLVAAIANVPATKLIETSPKGFNATGEHESENYADELESVQTNDMTPLVDRHHQLVVRSELGPKYGIRFEVAIEWNPTRSPKPSEIADLNLKKAQTGQALVQSGAISEDDERNRVMNDPDSGYSGLAEREEEDPVDEDDEGFSFDASDSFKEEDHERDKDGKFGSGGGKNGSRPEEQKGGQDITTLLGEEHTGVTGQSAITTVLEAQGGHVRGAFTRSDIGKIDLAWGDDSFGLKHIMQRRADQGLDSDRFVAGLAQVIEKGKLKAKEDGRFIITHNDNAAVVTPELRGNKLTLLLTAFETDKPSLKNKKRR